jgi:hypothetical protein
MDEVTWLKDINSNATKQRDKEQNKQRETEEDEKS